VAGIQHKKKKPSSTRGIQTQIDSIALAYYRYERIIQDIAAYCEQILLTDSSGG